MKQPKYHEDLFVNVAFNNYLDFRKNLGPVAYSAAADSLLEEEQRNELRVLVSKYKAGELKELDEELDE